MKKLLPLVLSVMFVAPVCASWPDVAAKVSKSIAYLTGPAGHCTAFTIDADRDYMLTAGHCEQSSIRVGGLPATIVYKDEKKDLMVLEVKGDDHPALHLAAEPARIGEEVASYGYGYALERPLFRFGHVSDDDFHGPEVGVGGPYTAIDSGFIGGQSGGPVVNAAGEVVAVVQMTTESMGIGVGVKVIKDKTGRFWSKEGTK